MDLSDSSSDELSSFLLPQLWLPKVNNFFCLHSYMNPIYSNLMLFNDSKYMYNIWMTLCPIYQFRAKTSNNVSEFMHSNWIMLSYYSSPKHKDSAS